MFERSRTELSSENGDDEERTRAELSYENGSGDVRFFQHKGTKKQRFTKDYCGRKYENCAVLWERIGIGFF